MPRPPVTGPGRSRCVYPGTFDPFTAGHRDLVDRSRRLFDHVTVLVAVNAGKQPARTGEQRAQEIRAALPADWGNVTVVAWSGLTADYCKRHAAAAIVRGVRNALDAERESQLAAMNEALGVPTVFLPARPELATVSSTAVRATTT
ncbi:pantetheine-phosphate adenylyltransferase [Micromonospora mirobrigensis]|uniref:Phosphopantetheine adenylyltransferase n=1 Tax=Micromonospora mirobrigensis TaxID=262898 RepID=A0A1C4YGJ7_9ACTN|nr:pantetheine-phosphate adenylyltransferase [Micromonospora mirobrigensis]SCF19834.1 Phosphopantetheine adenylyltransferase [Micromonospora mirobrigensis]